MNSFHFKTLDNPEIILSYAVGKIEYEELLAFKAMLISMKNIHPAFKLLVDLRDSEIEITQTHMDTFLLDIRVDSNSLDGKDLALLTSSPTTVLAAFIFTSGNNEINYFDMVFTTLPAALNHLNLHASHEEPIEKAIKELKREIRKLN